MRKQFSMLDFKVIPITILILYVPFHILEEGLNNFPEWMSTQYGLPIVINYPHWLFNNVFFFATLLIGLVLFLRKEKYLFLGVGIMIWSIMNSFEHLIGTVLNSKMVPGFYTGILFLIVAVSGIIKLSQDKKLTKKLIISSLLAAFLFWIIPMGLIVLTGNIWLKILY